MKTTIEIQDELFERGKALARRENSTLRALIEEGLRLAIQARTRRPAQRFEVQPFQGDGLTPEFEGAGWEKLRDVIHGDRQP
jgi:predicted transcriptional regulator